MRLSINVQAVITRVRSRSVKTTILSALTLVSLHGNIVDDAAAAFSLNWQRDYASEGATFSNNDGYIVCNMSYIASANCGSRDMDENGSHDDGTAFMQEQLNFGGQSYFHVIVGDYTQDSMVQEVFIRNSGSYDGVPMTSSVANTSSTANAEFNMDKPYSSDSSTTGTGSANPNNVIMRQIVNSGEISMEFLKDSFTQKPLITSTLTTAGLVSTFSMDMRGSNYSQMTPIAVSSVVNTVVLTGADSQGQEGDYDFQNDAQTSYMSAGGFTYTAGTGAGGSGGTYSWFDPTDNFQPMNRNYASYCDAAQNPNWSGVGACVDGTGGGGGGGW